MENSFLLPQKLIVYYSTTSKPSIGAKQNQQHLIRIEVWKKCSATNYYAIQKARVILIFFCFFLLFFSFAPQQTYPVNVQDKGAPRVENDHKNVHGKNLRIKSQFCITPRARVCLIWVKLILELFDFVATQFRHRNTCA